MLNKFRTITRRRFLSASAATAAYTMIPKNAASAADDPRPAPLLNPKWQDEGVIDLSKSPHAKLKTVPVHAVVIEPGFWSRRRAINVESSIPSMHDELLAHGRMDNFLRLDGKSAAPQDRTRLFGLRYLQVDGGGWFSTADRRSARAAKDHRCNDSRCCGNPGTERLSEHLLQR